MESREDLHSILPFLPLILRSSSLFWPSKAQEILKTLALGPEVSLVVSGGAFFASILDLRGSVGLLPDSLCRFSAEAYSRYFDELISRLDSMLWFGDTIPALAMLLLKLPSLLETHYQNSDEIFERRSGLRVLGQQEAGFVFLSQELIASLLSCALFCLFSSGGRGKICIRSINFDSLFEALHSRVRSSENKINCLVNYFRRVCQCMPTGYVSFERKVLPFEEGPTCISYPSTDVWMNSNIPLCSFKIFHSGLIEDQEVEALEVDFANENLGGGALSSGCVQEEIRFMINPELIVGMLFMDTMDKNEAIEIFGVERFSTYTGYGSSFCFAGDLMDNKAHDPLGRRKTRIVAIDAVYNPGRLQYRVECLQRETNKAFCGFYDCSKHLTCLRRFQDSSSYKHCLYNNLQKGQKICNDIHTKNLKPEGSGISSRVGNNCSFGSVGETERNSQALDYQEEVGIATGNWGCGAFGGDPEIKSMIQWLAASQARRPFVHYYTFGEPALQRLEKVIEWISAHGWTVGELWSLLVEYSMQKLNNKTRVGFLNWVRPEPPPPPNDKSGVGLHRAADTQSDSSSFVRFFKK